MRQKRHGGGWAAFEREYGREPLDFSANISPLGVPECVRSAMAEAAARCDRYPDPDCRALREALAEAYGVPAEQILCGGGSADLLYRLVLSEWPEKALVTAPAFTEYERALALAGCTGERFPLAEENGFAVTEDILSWITPETDLVFLCEPNNPTGVLTPKPLRQRIRKRCRETGTLLVVDECFLDFLDAPEEESMVPELEDGPGLLILKAFTKLYAMAGARLGFCLSADTALLDRMKDAGPPWAVSLPAQEGGIAALRERAYAARVRELVRTQRGRMKAQLEAMGLPVIDGQANYLLFRGPEGLADRLEEYGILLRCCADYHGLDSRWYRAAVRTEEENNQLLQAVREVL